VQGPDLPQVDREGVLTVDGEAHEVVLQDLPTVVEAYKSLDDTNLVKIADVGQVRVRGLWVRREH
jgi:TATA-binding protein-associated factor Taf7